MKIRKNPYLQPMSQEAIAAWQTMPVSAGGIVSLFHLPPGQVASAEEAWRKWCRRTDRSLWPLWIDQWAAEKARKAGKIAQKGAQEAPEAAISHDPPQG